MRRRRKQLINVCVCVGIRLRCFSAARVSTVHAADDVQHRYGELAATTLRGDIAAAGLCAAGRSGAVQLGRAQAKASGGKGQEAVGAVIVVLLILQQRVLRVTAVAIVAATALLPGALPAQGGEERLSVAGHACDGWVMRGCACACRACMRVSMLLHSTGTTGQPT
jgi:hypothetical protein